MNKKNYKYHVPKSRRRQLPLDFKQQYIVGFSII